MSTYEAIPTELLQLLSAEQAWHYRLVPVRREGNAVAFACARSEGLEDLLNELEMIVGVTPKIEFAESAQVDQLLTLHYRRRNGEGAQAPTRVGDQAGSEDFVVKLIEEANSLGSSDIHIETYKDRARVRIRVDGHLIERYVLDQATYPALINKVKILAQLDIAERRLPQDGRIFFDRNGKAFDLRVSALPTLHGEKIVLRLLAKDATKVELSILGMAKGEQDRYLEAVKRPHGMILISGPTGSGKTTTLYATLRHLNDVKRNILTIEDPIEYTLEGINQVQLREGIGLDFVAAMRSFLRQDPDVIMVGEIRDTPTAQMAIRASLTGHLVFSTIHTNSSWGTVTRLVDMGIPAYLVASTLVLSVAQRLVRTLCPSCREKSGMDPDLLPPNYRPTNLPDHHFVAKGCEQCHYTGYKGRRAVYEVLPIETELVDQIRKQESAVGELLESRGIRSLSQNAFALLGEGITSVEEIYPILAVPSWS